MCLGLPAATAISNLLRANVTGVRTRPASTKRCMVGRSAGRALSPWTTSTTLPTNTTWLLIPRRGPRPPPPGPGRGAALGRGDLDHHVGGLHRRHCQHARCQGELVGRLPADERHDPE